MLNKEKPVEVILNKEKCKKCGKCIAICGNYLKTDEEGYPCAKTKNETSFGCIQCGSCMMTCENDGIEVIGQDIDREHLRDLNRKFASFEQLDALFLKRRSIRSYKDEPVSKDIINKIITASSKAPISIPPSEVKVLVINGKEKVQEFADDIVAVMDNMMHSMNPLVAKAVGSVAKIVKPNLYKIFNDFIIPLSNEIIAQRKNGVDVLFYNAPAVAIFYGTPLASSADVMLASAYADIATEALGLGSCFIGTVAEVFQRDLKLKHKYGIFRDEQVGIAFTLGYSNVEYKKAIQRDFKEVRIIE